MGVVLYDLLGVWQSPRRSKLLQNHFTLRESRVETLHAAAALRLTFSTPSEISYLSLANCYFGQRILLRPKRPADAPRPFVHPLIVADFKGIRPG